MVKVNTIYLNGKVYSHQIGRCTLKEERVQSYIEHILSFFKNENLSYGEAKFIIDRINEKIDENANGELV